jgi:hypothetical protein
VARRDPGLDEGRAVGQASVGWAMYFSGAARMRWRNSSISDLLDAGPTSMP